MVVLIIFLTFIYDKIERLQNQVFLWIWQKSQCLLSEWQYKTILQTDKNKNKNLIVTSRQFYFMEKR